MQLISFQEFAQICADNKVTHVNTNLVASFDKQFPDLPIGVGHDNDKESFDVDAQTFSEIILGGNCIQATYSDCHARKGETERFVWEHYKS
jgi:hypothetical protein